MIIPRFSLRWLLALVTACAGLSLVLSYAIRGEPWAIGIAVGMGTLLSIFVLGAFMFCIDWLISQVLFSGKRWRYQGESPFATAASEANALPPAEPN